MTRGARRGALAAAERWRAMLGAGLVVAGVVAGCVELGAPKGGVISISGLRIASPAVVIGDILRDSLGLAAPLELTAFDGSGNPIAGEPVSFFALDSTIKVDADGTVHGLLRDSLGARLVGGAGTLQTLPQRVFVSVRPDTATRTTESASIVFDLTTPDTTAQTNWSPPLTLTLVGVASAKSQGFIVDYRILRSPTPATAGAPTAYLADDAGRASARDTTDRQGNAGRRVVLRQQAIGDAALLGGSKTDTITVRATVKYLGADVTGSPIDFFVAVSRKPAAVSLRGGRP
jgi:hypothetical protein